MEVLGIGRNFSIPLPAYLYKGWLSTTIAWLRCLKAAVGDSLLAAEPISRGVANVVSGRRSDWRGM